jgi:hypothetical protein
VTTHAERGGCLHRLAATIPDNARVPDGAEFVGYARLVRPSGHYADAPTCTLYHLPGTGYIAADVCPHRD